MIQWYPGHMAKTKKTIISNLKLIDIVYEVVDARIPLSSRNPIIDEIIGNKKRILILNKSDLSDNIVNDLWIIYFKKMGIETSKINALSGLGISDLVQKTNKICSEIIKNKKSKGMIPRLRVMILGIPNVGKSALINRLSGGKKAQTGDKPGITRKEQWIKTQYFDLLDTPGILWPKFEDPMVGLMLALTGAIKDDILDIEELSFHLVGILKNKYKNILKTRYKIENTDKDNYEILKDIGKNRGCLLPGGDIDVNKAAKLLITDFRSGRMGNISLERP
ncbi:MAG: ribosome biogenesis GTPase YlqF [Thermoanaerobacteraceae bacterium]